MLNKTSGNIDFSEKMLLKCLKKVNKTIIYNFFLPFHPSTLFMKCNGYTNYNQPKKPNIGQPTIVVQASAHVRISFLIITVEKFQ